LCKKRILIQQTIYYGGFTGEPFNGVCEKCGFKRVCVGAGRLSQIGARRGNHVANYIHPILGIIDHERLANMRNLKTSPQEIIESIRSGKDIIFSAFICSPTYRLRGTPDAVVVKHKNGRMEMTVIEDKSKDHSEDLKQAIAYAIILTDKNAQIILNHEVVRLYDGKPSSSVSVFLNFYNLGSKDLKELKRQVYHIVSQEGKFNSEIKELIEATLRKADTISKNKDPRLEQVRYY
jgi:hypothetical protein